MEPFSAFSAACSVILLPILLGYGVYIIYHLIKDTGKGIGKGAKNARERIRGDEKKEPKPKRERRRRRGRDKERAAEASSSLLSIDNIRDLSAVWKANWDRDNNRVKASGFISTPKDADTELKDKRVEFSLDISGVGRPSGTIEALMKEHAYNYVLQPSSIEFFMDNALLGTVDMTGTVFDQDGMPIGMAAKSDRAPVVFRAGIMRQSTRAEYIEVILGDAVVAYITDVPWSSIERLKRFGTGETPLAVSIAKDATKEEVQLITALTLLQIIGFIALNVMWESDPPEEAA